MSVNPGAPRPGGRFDRGEQPSAVPPPTPGHEPNSAEVQDLLQKYDPNITRRAIYITALQAGQTDVAEGVSDIATDADRRLSRDGDFIGNAMALQRLIDADPLAGELVLLTADQLQEEAKRQANQPPHRRGLGVEEKVAKLLRQFRHKK